MHDFEENNVVNLGKDNAHDLEEEENLGKLREKDTYGGEEDLYKTARREILHAQLTEKEDAAVLHCHLSLPAALSTSSPS